MIFLENITTFLCYFIFITITDCSNKTILVLAVIFKDNLCKLVPECQTILDCAASRDSCDDINQLNCSVKEPNKFHIYETGKITHKPSDAAEYIELFGSFTRNRHARRILMLFSERSPIYASLCMTISGERTEQHVVIGFGELAAVDYNR